MDVARRQYAATGRGCGDGGRVYLTFDDGPDPEWTPRIVDVLDASGARATFFVIGRAAERFGPLLRRLHASGHEIGNHTYSHRHPWTMSTAHARREVRDGAESIAQALGRAPRWFRPPHGRLRQAMADEARCGGQCVVLWTLSAVDWGPLGCAERIAARLNQVDGGDIILMHDSRNRHNRPEETLRVLPAFLEAIGGRGLAPSLLDPGTCRHGRYEAGGRGPPGLQ